MVSLSGCRDQARASDLHRVTALAFWFVDAGGLNSRTSYPHLFLGSSTDTNVIRSLDACAKCGLLRAMCMSSNQT